MREFRAGVKAGLPVCLGYFSVSFGFGAMAVSQGLNFWQAVLISVSNLTSAGQFAGLTVMVAGGSLVEMLLTQLVINSRYALMSLALSQRLRPRTGERLLAAYFNTDEVFALGMARRGQLTAAYFVGAGLISALGWTAGTALGAVAGTLLPETLRAALGILLYGMFVAIVIPQIRAEQPMGICAALALVLSCLLTWLPGLKEISGGLGIVLCTVGAAAVCAWLFPVPDEEGEV